MLYQAFDHLYPHEYSTPEVLLLYLQIPSRIMFIYVTLSTPFNSSKSIGQTEWEISTFWRWTMVSRLSLGATQRSVSHARLLNSETCKYDRWSHPKNCRAAQNYSNAKWPIVLLSWVPVELIHSIHKQILSSILNGLRHWWSRLVFNSNTVSQQSQLRYNHSKMGNSN